MIISVHNMQSTIKIKFINPLSKIINELFSVGQCVVYVINLYGAGSAH